MGKPKKPKGESRENVLRIRLTEAERKALDTVAERQTLDTSTWARSMLLEAARSLLKRS